MMTYKKMITAAALLASAALQAGSPSAPYENSSIDARLNVAVKDGTQVVHFVRDNADPSVFTKIYVLKHADPYELRSYLRQIVQTRSVNSNNTNITPVCFTDGTAVLLISAEKYRFADSKNGQGFDSIIKELDRPKITAVTGRPTYIYTPKYRSSAELMAMVQDIGMYTANLRMNNMGGSDAVANDDGLNLMFFKTSPFSRATITEMLDVYDQPYPEVNARITVYELYAENDTKLGADWQAWKNNDGIDFFSGGGRFMRNHNGADLVRGAGWSDTRYFQFNPKWNTKYIDFLTSKGKAKILHSAEMVIRSNETAKLERMTQVFLAKPAPVNEDASFIENYGKFNVGGAAIAVGLTMHGDDIVTAQGTTSVTVLKTGKGSNVQYTFRIPDGETGSFIINGRDVGRKAIAGVVLDGIETQLLQNTAGHERGNTVTTESSDTFGFRMELTPSVSAKATSLNVKIQNSSLIGYTSDGSARIQEGAGVDTDFMISNSGTRLLIGNIEKRDVVSVSGGIPILKDLPLLGWLFSTESEATKRSQLLVVAEIMPVRNKLPQTVKKVSEKLSNAGESNTFGYRQYLIDSDR